MVSPNFADWRWWCTRNTAKSRLSTVTAAGTPRKRLDFILTVIVLGFVKFQQKDTAGVVVKRRAPKRRGRCRCLGVNFQKAATATGMKNTMTPNCKFDGAPASTMKSDKVQTQLE